jgi:C-terminal processing protease CtpA/Prc
MMAAEDSSPNPLLQRAGRAAASLAVVLSLALPAYVAPGAAAAQSPTTPSTEQQKNGPAKSDSAVQKIQEKAELFGEILADLQDLYVEPVDLDKLAETGFQAMLSSLDPYTEFENVEAAKVMRTQTIGNYGGVGLVITKNKDTKGNDQAYISVVNAFEGYAFDAGMRVGDTLISVDGKDVKDTSTNDVSLMLKGEPGSKVALKYKRPGLDQVQVLPLSFAQCTEPVMFVGWHSPVSVWLDMLTVLTRCADVWVTLPDVRAYAQDCAAT